jgi:hypothetical protein
MLRSAREHYRRQSRATALAVAAARRVWDLISFADLDGSWAQFGARMAATVTAGQRLAVRGADDYVSAALLEQDLADDPVGVLAESVLTGVTGAGVELGEALYSAVITVKVAVSAGVVDETDAMLRGRNRLDLVSSTAVQDAGRAAEVVAAASRRVDTYVRMLNPPSCSRCVILAGTVWRMRDPFERHPSCNCLHIPSAENVAGDLTTDPQVYFDSLSDAERDRVFTKAGARVVQLGADLAQVVNARRGALGLTPATRRLTAAEARAARGGGERGRLQRSDVAGRQVFTTTSGGPRRRGRRKAVRLMPESLLELAVGDTDEAVRLLKLHGYIL